VARVAAGTFAAVRFNPATMMWRLGEIHRWRFARRETCGRQSAEPPRFQLDDSRTIHVPRSEVDLQHIHAEISELVKRALLQAGDLQDVEEKLKGIVDRACKITPPSEAPPT